MSGEWGVVSVLGGGKTKEPPKTIALKYGRPTGFLGVGKANSTGLRGNADEN